MSNLQAQGLLGSHSTETDGLRKRAPYLVNHENENLLLNLDFLKANKCDEGYVQIRSYSSTKDDQGNELPPALAKPSYQSVDGNRLINLQTAAMTSAKKTDTVLTHSSFSRDPPTLRRFSESSADEMHRSANELLRRANMNKTLERNEILTSNKSVNAATLSRKSQGYCAGYDHSDDDDDDDEEGDGKTTYACCCYSGGKSRNRISDAIDVGIRIALVIIFIYLERTKAFKRILHPEEMWLYKNPRTPDIVSAKALLLSVTLCPFIVTILHLCLTGNRRDFRAANWVWTLALGLNGVVTGILKIAVGRHRPDFFYRCFPDGIEVFNNFTIEGADILNCTGDLKQIAEGRKSFPSGHASFAFVAFGFIALYIGAKLHTFSPRARGQSWRLCITLMPLLFAALMAISRTCDYHHHWQDVVVGSVIGFSIMYVVYRQYYPPLTSRNCHRSYLRACRRLRKPEIATQQVNSKSSSAIYEPLLSNDGNNDGDDDDGEIFSYEPGWPRLPVGDLRMNNDDLFKSKK